MRPVCGGCRKQHFGINEIYPITHKHTADAARENLLMSLNKRRCLIAEKPFRLIVT